MGENVKNFLLLNAGILLVVGLYMYFGKPKSKKSKFLAARGKSSGTYPPPRRAPQPPESAESAQLQGKEKTLNVIFQFNGHSFEAYESLGLPAGTSLDKVEKAYQEALKNTEDSEAELLHLAYQAILKSN